MSQEQPKDRFVKTGEREQYSQGGTKTTSNAQKATEVVQQMTQQQPPPTKKE